MPKPPADPDPPSPPEHLAADTKRWFADVCAEYELAGRQIMILVLACEAWDRCSQARAAIEEHGPVFVDRFGCPRARPEVQIERASRSAFVRVLRELDLAGDPPAVPRPGGRQPGVPLLSQYRNRRR
jgi:phage terminase small subunit